MCAMYILVLRGKISLNFSILVAVRGITSIEKLFRNDSSYNYFIVINYNTKKIVPNKGSAIFLHLTKKYKKTIGCIAIKEKDFLILLKLINKKTKIKIC